MEKSYIDSIIDPEIDKLNRSNEHLLNQIEMFENMIHNYKLKQNENNEKITELEKIKSLQ